MDSDPYFPIEEWAKTPTWNTFHPIDLDRFDYAIGEVYDALGLAIDLEEVRSRIDQHASEPIWPISPNERETTITTYVDRAEGLIHNYSDSTR
ncbi:hypothetical protein [Cerasicoccus fimbriatus]|uniref:hypothetical protein n=1 Tax=Cerasicoccus fimbriatus TaxID=3014554 RepID=UPI0022B56EDB|nr:hypothetical protein [Cerasicoccus sp. TK19100]